MPPKNSGNEVVGAAMIPPLGGCAVATAPSEPTVLRVGQSCHRIDRFGFVFVRGVPCQNARHNVAFGHGEICDRRHVAAVERKRRVEHKSIRASNCAKLSLVPLDPTNDSAKVKTE